MPAWRSRVAAANATATVGAPSVGPNCAPETRLLAWLEALLPPLQVRVRGRRLPELAARLAEIAELPEASDDARHELACLAILLVRVIEPLQRELTQLDRRVAEHLDAHARASTAAARRRQLERLIDETAASPAAARADRRALARELDFDALRERLDLDRERKVVTIELALLALAPAVARAGVMGEPEPAQVPTGVRWLAHTQPIARLSAALAQLGPWTSRLACVAAIHACLRALAPLGVRGPADTFPRLDALARAAHEHPWVRASAYACLLTRDPEQARPGIAARLGLTESLADRPARDFLVRRRLVALLSERLDHPADAELLVAAITVDDPSELVRLGHVAALVPLARTHPDELARLAPTLLARPHPDEGGSGPSEPREPGIGPRVRASACRAMVAGLLGRLDDDPPRPALAEHLDLVVTALAEAIVDDTATLVARVACEAAAELCEALVARARPVLAASAGARLVAALHRSLADDAREPVVHDAAAATLESIDEALRPERAELSAALRAVVLAIPPGGVGRAEVPPDLSDPELARVLAHLTRDDWGLDVDRRGAELSIRRGDHLTTRAWRIVHELRHPAANKRQGHAHTHGRRFVGRLRAHPSRLDEVTATVVPGERLHVDAEGGWGRHLPSVDDLLGLPWLRGGGGPGGAPSGEPSGEVVIASSHGLTHVRLTGHLGQRLRARVRLDLDYAALAQLRNRALAAREASERRRYADQLRRAYGIELDFTAHPSPLPGRPTPARLRALFPPSATGLAPVSPLALASGAPELVDLRYFLTLEGNDQASLGLFALGLASVFLGAGYLRRRRIARARAAIPLCIGGWGTRGKSGTERLKAGLFHGLGFRVFAKTTGCEAMFLHAAPLGPQIEIFAFRPYGKATIWEQRELLELAAGLGAEVFLWECMALNPEYVDILQRGWMRDDLATITNTYPDHEDIQGPAGIDVARVIARFIPDQRTVISSELAFNPVLRAEAAARGATLVELGDHDGDLIAADLLGLFPYAEHPRNIALVAELARTLGIDPELAIVTMAEHVYPDLGVLKRYPEVVVAGRRLAFINGCSANERAGFLNNWRRTGCDALAAAGDPARMVMTVVNNRDDRVSRSEVFSRILVRDVSVDAHLLIGTNLAGLRIFLDRALASFAAEQELLDPEGLAAGGPAHDRARARLRGLLARVRAPVDDGWAALARLLELGLAALGRRFDPEAPAARTLAAHVERERQREGPLDHAMVVAELHGDRGFERALAQLSDAAPPADSELAEALARAEVGPPARDEELGQHLRDRAARAIVAARLSTQLEAALARRDPAALEGVTRAVRTAWISLF